MNEPLEIVSVGHENSREWYKLGFLPAIKNDGVPGILLGMSETSIMSLLEKFPNFFYEDSVKTLKYNGVEAEFLTDLNKPWGFGGVLRPYQNPDATKQSRLFREYVIDIPETERETDTCKNCDGIGEDDSGFNCFCCGGDGKGRSISWTGLQLVAATLYTLSPILDSPYKEWVNGVASKKNQLLSITNNYEEGRTFISADLSIEFSNYLRSRSMTNLTAVVEATKETFLRMFPSYKKFGDYHFVAEIREKGQLIIGVPGDACGIYVDGMSGALSDPTKSFELDCHHIDNIHQQITCLAGLACLAGIARRDLHYED